MNYDSLGKINSRIYIENINGWLIFSLRIRKMIQIFSKYRNCETTTVYFEHQSKSLYKLWLIL